MTFRVKKRGDTWRLEGRAGERLRRGTKEISNERGRVRLSLGTMNGDAAHLLHNKIERALAEGPGSALWRELRGVLPPETFSKLAALAGYDEAQNRAPVRLTWADLSAKFSNWMVQRVKLGKLRDTTSARYLQTMAAFDAFLKERAITELEHIRRDLVEDFKAWQLARVLAKKNSRGGRGVVLDAAILHRVFAYAIECEISVRNPVRLEGRPGDDPERGAQPFKAEELVKLQQAAGDDLLAFLLLRHTGFRGSDAVGLRWEEIDWQAREVDRLTQKRRKRVVLPLHQELLFALEVEREKRKPQPEDRVLLNPGTGRVLTRPRLYQRMAALGRRAGVVNVHPHRFRDTCAVELLVRGASPYDVAKVLGDTVATVEKHYAPFVPELRARVRRIMESPGVLEIAGTQRAQERKRAEKPN